jgi:hypothetical protein
MKLQIDEGVGNGFDFYFFLDRINRIIGDFFACGEEPSGRRPHNPNDPVDPVQLSSFRLGIHSFLRYSLFQSFFFDLTCRFFGRWLG